MRGLSVTLLGVCLVPLMSLARPDPVEIGPLPPPPFDEPMVPALLSLPTLPYVGAEPLLEQRAVRRRIKVTACSPQDSAVDSAYYKANGYEGSPYNIAAHQGTFPEGTMIRVPGYLAKSHPGQFWEVDSRGGPVIRRAAARGVTQIDVKFRTRDAVVKWGVQWLTVEIVSVDAQARWEAEHAAWERSCADYRRVAALREEINAENERRLNGNRSGVSTL